jgi:LmbE family N-acetylglucosaminyl deacetylase
MAPITFASPPAAAVDITGSTAILGDGYDKFDFLTDGNTTAYHTSNGKCTITLLNEEGIGSIYLMFDLEYGEYTIENAANGKSITAGQEGFLHEYIDLNQAFQGPVTSLYIHFERGKVRLSELEVYSVGTVPEHVQIWQPPLEGETDLLLLSSHGDDDQLFFAGLLPKYAGQEGAAVQVAYLTNHRNLTNQRTHEILNGLWATGCTAYPVLPDFPDFRIDDLQKTYKEFERLGYPKDQLMSYVTGLLRRFKPQVVVGHDIEGEYGHGMHMVYTDCLLEALKVSNDETYLPEQVASYGVWDVPKTYLHLYDKNTIELDYDQPLSAFDGMTAFEVTQKLGYPCHKSQQSTWFTGWLNGDNGEITKASQIKRHNPCRFGLYRTTVGDDVVRQDFLENITTYREQEEAEQLRLEQERLEKEAQEQERLEAERQELDRIEAEKAEKKRLEEERLEAERLEQERLQQEQHQRQRSINVFILIGITLVGSVFIVVHLILKRRAYLKGLES